MSLGESHTQTDTLFIFLMGFVNNIKTNKTTERYQTYPLPHRGALK